MRAAFASIALAALAAANPVAVPQGVTSAITPKTTAPAGCSPNYSGSFQIQVVNVSSTSTKRSFEKRQSGALTLTLSGGILKDAKGRTGYIAANRQFQFDAPPQTGAIYTAGWSVCSNGSLAIGGDAIFQQCLSGTFYNLYDEATSAQCSPVYIDVIGGGSSGAASVQSDGQPTASPKSAAPVSQLTDGQPQASTKATAAPVSQITDGQVQASTKATAAPVSQISDGQIQASTQATARPVTQISDGQIQATTSASPVQQISDGQIQQHTSASIVPTGAAVSQIGDGQPQTNGTVASASPSVQPYTGAAHASYNPFLPLLALPAILVGFVYAL